MGGAEVLLLGALLGAGAPGGGSTVMGVPLGVPVALGVPPSRPPCRPVNVTVAAEKDECPQCLAVTTTACGGYCRTRPVYRSPLGGPAQQACGYGALRYERLALPGCAPGADPTVAVPVALSCRCARCPMATADCTVAGLGPAFCGAPAGFGPQ
ncbi:lutropin subunit beta isoform X2 [Struthio camelus]|uniref:lutropin subunit beta isoform X2 n=1 Tax=Struthio camelus TaxID=8801 RepID=UPI0036041787